MTPGSLRWTSQRLWTFALLVMGTTLTLSWMRDYSREAAAKQCRAHISALATEESDYGMRYGQFASFEALQKEEQNAPRSSEEVTPAFWAMVWSAPPAAPVSFYCPLDGKAYRIRIVGTGDDCGTKSYTLACPNAAKHVKICGTIESYKATGMIYCDCLP